ncbi:MAG: metallopeptidase family protein [Elusimicrobiota bacterium]
MRENRFRELLSLAVDRLPEEFRRALENIEIVVEERPAARHRALLRDRGKDWTLLGLYEGIPLNQRDTGYSGVLPDKITLFRKPIMEHCGGGEDAVIREIHRTFLHEVGHYFGLSEQRLRELGYD